jgi:hypothetical protein
MPKFFVTYGNNSDLADCYSEIEAPDYDSARAHVIRITDGQFAFMYEEKDYPRAIGRFALSQVDLRPQRFSNYDES